jgi:hypothetical protein
MRKHFAALLACAACGVTPARALVADSPNGLFSPEFTVLSRDDDPAYKLKKDPATNYTVPSWKTLKGRGETQSLFEAGHITVTTATVVEQTSAGVHWKFPKNGTFQLQAELLRGNEHDSLLELKFTPLKAGWYSVGYTGAMPVSSSSLQQLWQPHVWQELRFPEKPFLSIESMCSLPAVLMTAQGNTVGVAAHPAEGPYRLPTTANSRYGVALRNQQGQAQPMLFAPVLGGTESHMDAGQTYSFRMHMVQRQGDCDACFRWLAQGLFGFHDYRENVGCSLNTTLENMLQFAMNDAQSGWIADLRGSDYTTDVPGTVKNVSALHPLSLALVTDNPDIYQRRALPMMEYLLSRQKYLFAIREGITGQGASHLLRGPAAEVSELAALFEMTGRRNSVLSESAVSLFDKPRALNLNMVSAGGSWQNALALYRLTGEHGYLERAEQGADAYLQNRLKVTQQDFADVHVETGGQFWTDYAPKWVDLFELYEETKKHGYLEAAARGARMYTEYSWMHPRIPDGETTVNKGGQVPVYNKRQISDPQPMQAAEQSVPAWILSQIGLTPEASRTHTENPAIMLAHFAPYMLRIASLTQDSFLHAVARSAVVGRYQNFPGYDINGEFTNVYARPDYPLRGYTELTYNNIYYNHVWPHIALVTDFLVSDAEVKSAGKIRFPSRYAQGYAFLSSKVYGDRPGEFYGDGDVRLWMPRQLLSTDNIQVNYVSGFGNGRFYLALMNQSTAEQTVCISLNPGVLPINTASEYPARVWIGNEAAATQMVRGAKLQLTVAPSSIAAVAIDGINVSPRLSVQAAEIPEQQNYTRWNTEIGDVTYMRLGLGEQLPSYYVWLQATE